MTITVSALLNQFTTDFQHCPRQQRIKRYFIYIILEMPRAPRRKSLTVRDNVVGPMDRYVRKTPRQAHDSTSTSRPTDQENRAMTSAVTYPKTYINTDPVDRPILPRVVTKRTQICPGLVLEVNYSNNREDVLEKRREEVEELVTVKEEFDNPWVTPSP